MTELIEQRAAAELDPDARMDAYYYGFYRTDVGIVDRILSELAIAGKAYHGTADWADEYEDKYWPTRKDRRSHERRIQDAANDAAVVVRELIAEVQRLRFAYAHSGDHMCDECWPG